MSRQGDRVDAFRLSLVFEWGRSTSVSSLLLSSIDAARHEPSTMVRDCSAALWTSPVIRRRIAVAGLDLMGEAVLSSPGADYFDPTHATVDVLGLGPTGYQAADRLRERHGLTWRWPTSVVSWLVTCADPDATTGRVVAALTVLVEAHAAAERVSAHGARLATRAAHGDRHAAA